MSERQGITVIPSKPESILTRQQRRHAKQAREYEAAIAKQGKRYIKGYHNNPKGLPHIGAKQLAKMTRKQNANAHP